MTPACARLLLALPVALAALGCAGAAGEAPPTGATAATTAPPAEPPEPPAPEKGPAAPPAEEGEKPLEATAKCKGKSLREWIALLGDRDDLTRSDAADAVARYGPNARDAVPALVALLKDPKDLSFVSALLAIGKIGPAAGDAADPLLALLKHKDANIRALAAGTLADLGPAAGKAVPPLIAALAAAKDGTEGERDALRSAIRQLGKYDLRAVFAAIRRDELNDLDLDSVLDLLGPDDAQAVAPLTEEVKKRDEFVFHSLAGLKRIGPKAASSLPAIRALLNDKKPDVRKSAAEAIAAIDAKEGGDVPKKDGPQDAAPKKGEAPEDIAAVIERAGFDARSGWAYNLAPYVRFGSKEAAGKFARGDKFDEIEVNKAAEGHRDALRKKSFRAAGLKFRPAVRDDVETRGLVAELALPMRVRGAEPFYEDRDAFSGVLAGMHPSELNAARYWFLTKDGTLKPCTASEARIVEKNNGVLYHPERGNTTLILVFKGKLENLRTLARESKDYSVEIAFSELAYQRPLAWGYFRRDAYFEADWDCQRLWSDYLLDPKAAQPPYFPTALGKEDGDNIPELVRARLDSLRVLDKNGKVVGGYRAGP